MEDAGIHRKNMVCDVVSGWQEVLQQETVLTDNATVIEALVNYVANAVKITQKQLATQLQQMQAMMQEMQLQYSAGPQNTYQYCGGRGYHSGHANYRVQGGGGAQCKGNW